MSTVNHDSQGAVDQPIAPDPRRWKALTVLAAIQFMLVVDVTVVNVALPTIQHNLHFSHQGLAWVVNGYALTAGGFLLLGGRLADTFGRRRMFLAGVIVFGAASAACGAATTSSMLVASRFIQGTGEALAGPAALAMIPLLFPDNKERMKALGVWGGIAALGGTTGSVISGALTGLASWRWIFYINIPIAVLALLIAPTLLSESRMIRTSNRIDLPGAILGTGGLTAISYGLLNAAAHSWGSWQVLFPLLGGVGLLGVLAAWESRVADPLIPLKFFTNRTRVTSNLLALVLFAAFIGYVFLLTLYMQQVLHYSPLRAGVVYLPLGIGIGLGMGVCTGLMPRIGVKAVLAIGFFGSAAALFVASLIHDNSSYAAGVLPGLLVFGIFSGICYPALINGGLHEVTGQDSGLGSGVQTAMQQIGVALGLGTLVTLAIRYANNKIGHGTIAPVALTDGYALAFRAGAIVLAVGGVLALLLLEHVTAKPRVALAEVPAEELPSTPSVTRA